MEVTIDLAVVAKDVFGIQVGYKGDNLLLEMKDSANTEKFEIDLVLNKIDYTRLYLNGRTAYVLNYKSIKVHKNHKDYVDKM